MTLIGSFFIGISSSTDMSACSFADEGAESSGNEFAAMLAMLGLIPVTLPADIKPQVASEEKAAPEVPIPSAMPEALPYHPLLLDEDSTEIAKVSLPVARAETGNIQSLSASDLFIELPVVTSEGGAVKTVSITPADEPKKDFQVEVINPAQTPAEPAPDTVTDMPMSYDYATGGSQPQAEYDQAEYNKTEYDQTEYKRVENNRVEYARTVDRLSPINNALARAVNLGRVDSLTGSETESEPAVATRDLLDKITGLYFRTDESGRVRDEKISNADPAFRVVVRAAMDDNQPEVIARQIKPVQETASASLSPEEDHNQPDASTNMADYPVAHSANGVQRSHEHAAPVSDSTLKSVAPQIINPLIEMARSLAPRETRRLRIHLRPEGFGEIHLQISCGNDGRLSADIIASLNNTHQALAEGVTRLRESLEQTGLSLDRLEVRLAAGSEGGNGSQTADGDQSPAYSTSARRHLSEPAAKDEIHPATPNERRLLSWRI